MVGNVVGKLGREEVVLTEQTMTKLRIAKGKFFKN
jgi:hypothetical protein